MKWFDYENPKTLSETFELLNKYGDDSRLIAGGTDLIVQMRIGRRTPKVVINTKAVDEMNELTCNSSGLTIYNPKSASEHLKAMKNKNVSRDQKILARREYEKQQAIN